jgi:quercetin dioxygenase-like cupin family protein
VTLKLAAFYLIFASMLLGTSAWSQSEHHKMIKADELKWEDVSAMPGAKLTVLEGALDKQAPLTFRIKFPANFRIQAHWHPTTEHVTVLSGTLNLGTGDKFEQSKTKALPAGGFAIMPAKMHHFAWTSEETMLQVHANGPWQVNYVNPADAPKKK